MPSRTSPSCRSRCRSWCSRLARCAVGFLGMPAWLHLPDFWSEWLHGVVAGIPDAEHHHHDATSGAIALVAGTLVGARRHRLRLGQVLQQALARGRAAHAVPPAADGQVARRRAVRRASSSARSTKIAIVSGNVDRVAVDGLTKLTATAVLARRLPVHAPAERPGARLRHGHGVRPDRRHLVGALSARAHRLGREGRRRAPAWPAPALATSTAGTSTRTASSRPSGARTSATSSYAYDAAQLRGRRAHAARGGGPQPGPLRACGCREGEEADLSTRHLGDGWRSNLESDAPPHVVLRGTASVLVRPGASTLTVNGMPASGDEIPVPVGSTHPARRLRQAAYRRGRPAARSRCAAPSATSRSTHSELVVQTRAEQAAASLTLASRTLAREPKGSLRPPRGEAR